MPFHIHSYMVQFTCAPSEVAGATAEQQRNAQRPDATQGLGACGGLEGAS